MLDKSQTGESTLNIIIDFVTLISALNIPFLLQAELNDLRRGGGPLDRENRPSLKADSWEGKAQEELGQASSVPSTNPTNERTAHSRRNFLPGSWRENEGGQAETALECPSWKHETR